MTRFLLSSPRSSERRRMYRSADPWTGELIREIPELNGIPHKTQESLLLSFRKLSGMTAGDRADVMHRIAGTLTAKFSDIAMSITREMGKPVRASRQEVTKSADTADYLSRHAAAALEDETVAPGMKVRYRPSGVLLGVMPWNFPLWQAVRFALPALCSGHPVIIKPAPNTSLTSEVFAGVCNEAFGFEAVQSLPLSLPAVHDAIARPWISGVAFTGSVATGRKIGESAGRSIKKSVLELGGSDAFIVLADGDVHKAAEDAVTSRMINCGQACNGAKRFIVHESIYETFMKKLQEKLEGLKFGNPALDETDYGPLARADIADTVRKQIRQTAESGARIVYCGTADHPLAVPPVIITQTDPDNPARRQEIFGPAFTVIPFRTTDEAIILANETEFGLGAAVYGDTDIMTVADALEAGNVFLNSIVRSDVRLPFGGIKSSGYGRELGTAGLREFCNVQAFAGY